MRVLVLGAYGMLGHKLVQHLSSDFYVTGGVRKIDESKNHFLDLSGASVIDGVDAMNISSIQDAISTTDPDVVINCIGLIKQKAEANLAIPTITLNALFPHQLAEVCKVNGSRVIHFSTDCVFSGSKGVYSLNDRPDADDYYGRTKLLGEIAYPHTITIRSSIVGRELGSKNGLFEWLISNRGGRVKGYANSFFSGLTTLEMSKVVKLIIKDHPDLSGLWQVAADPISKLDLISLLNKEMELGIDIDPDYRVKCDRTLDGSEFNIISGYSSPTWLEMVKEFVNDSVRYSSYFSAEGMKNVFA